MFKGSIKIKKVLKRIPLPLITMTTLDVGVGSGGFFSVLLEHYIYKIFIVDINNINIGDNRTKIDILQNVNVINIKNHYFHPKPQIVVIDISFNSIKNIFKTILPCIAKPSIIYILIKSQFEINLCNVSKMHRYLNRIILINIFYFMKVKLSIFINNFFLINTKTQYNSLEYWAIFQKII
jgi:23S rRNA (cytidine1920-2'-O)/16S rRNA (cytidine1409-2'-O)-methyltransferase